MRDLLGVLALPALRLARRGDHPVLIMRGMTIHIENLSDGETLDVSGDS